MTTANQASVLAHTARELRDQLPDAPGPRAVVMTMGALHRGHASLMDTARTLVGPDGTVVVTVFVNPLQFGPGEDFGRYPRTFDSDLGVCREHAVDAVFAPAVEEVYPREPLVRVDPGPLGDVLEGAARPGHFAGVLTVVLKMLNLVRPDVAVFGEKDYQQLVLVRAMVEDLAVGMRVVGAPTVREADGLALSSRNRYLSTSERTQALALSRALAAGAAKGPLGSAAVLDSARAILDAERGVELGYLELRGPDLGPAPQRGEARLLVAGRVGTTRLIDNVPVLLGPGTAA